MIGLKLRMPPFGDDPEESSKRKSIPFLKQSLQAPKKDDSRFVPFGAEPAESQRGIRKPSLKVKKEPEKRPIVHFSLNQQNQKLKGLLIHRRGATLRSPSHHKQPFHWGGRRRIVKCLVIFGNKIRMRGLKSLNALMTIASAKQMLLI